MIVSGASTRYREPQVLESLFSCNKAQGQGTTVHAKLTCDKEEWFSQNVAARVTDSLMNEDSIWPGRPSACY